MVKYIKGDLFTSKSPILCHACNCYGSWGAGVAAVFRKKFPKSYKIYNKHCKETLASKLLGTTLLIEPENGQRVACLFTSNLTGAKKLRPDKIIHYTDLAMKDLTNQLLALERESETLSDNDSTNESANESGGEDDNEKLKTNEASLRDVSMPKINAGLFGVPWHLTEEVVQKYDQLAITVYEI